MKEINYKLIISVLLILLITSVVFIIKLELDAKKRLEFAEQQLIEMKRLQDEIVRAQSKYVSSEDLNNIAKKLDIDLGQIKNDLSGFGASIQGLGKVIASSQGKTVIRAPSTDVSPNPSPNLPTCPDGTTCPNVDPFGYLSNSQHLFLSEPFGEKQVPIGTVTFEAWEERPWNYNIFPRNYHLYTVLGEDENGRHYVYNQFKIESNGTVTEVPISTSEFVEKRPEAKFRFDPHVNLGVAFGAVISTEGDLEADDSRFAAEVQPTLDVSLFSYGETKVNPTFKFLGLGIGYETQTNTLGFVVNPVDYNLGENISLINNFYIGPSVGVDLEGQVFVGAGIRVGL